MPQLPPLRFNFGKTVTRTVITSNKMLQWTQVTNNKQAKHLGRRAMGDERGMGTNCKFHAVRQSGSRAPGREHL